MIKFNQSDMTKVFGKVGPQEDLQEVQDSARGSANSPLGVGFSPIPL